MHTTPIQAPIFHQARSTLIATPLRQHTPPLPPRPRRLWPSHNWLPATSHAYASTRTLLPMAPPERLHIAILSDSNDTNMPSSTTRGTALSHEQSQQDSASSHCYDAQTRLSPPPLTRDYLPRTLSACTYTMLTIGKHRTIALSPST